MKLVKQLLCAALLVSAIAVTTPAGEQDTPGYAAPPPPRAMSTTDDPTISGSTDPQDGGITAETSNLLYDALAAFLSVY